VCELENQSILLVATNVKGQVSKCMGSPSYVMMAFMGAGAKAVVA